MWTERYQLEMMWSIYSSANAVYGRDSSLTTFNPSFLLIRHFNETFRVADQIQL